MSNYADRLRREKRTELAKRALPVESFNEYGEVTFATKTEAGASFPSTDYAYVPDAGMPSTWKLRLTASPGGTPDAGIVGAAIAALGPGGFRGNKVEIPAADLGAVKAKVAAAWKKANPDKKASEMPSFDIDAEELSSETEEVAADTGDVLVASCGDDDGPDVSFHIEVDDITVTPSPELLAAFKKLVDAAQFSYNGSDVSVSVDVDADSKADPKEDYDTELCVDADGLSQTPPDLVKTSHDALVTQITKEFGASFSLDVDIDVDSSDMGMDTPSYDYSEDTEEFSFESEEFGMLPPALAAALVKKLKADLAKQTDPAKKAEIQAKIDKFTKGA